MRARTITGRWAVTTIAAAALAAAAVVTTTQPASADINQQIRSAQARLDSLNHDSEIAAERYNRARIAFAQAQQRAVIADRALARARQAYDARHAAVARFAAQAYINGSLDNSMRALLAGDHPTDVLDEMSTLDAISRSQAQTLQDAAAARHEQAAAQAVADAAAAQQQQALNAAEHEKQTVERNAAEAQRVLTELRQKQAQLIRAAREAAARRAAQRRAAELARQQYLARVAAAAFARQSVGARDAAPTPDGRYTGSAAQIAIQVAKAQLGKPYVWAAAGPDTFDCSGLTMYAYGKAGIALSHYTGAQWNEGRHVSRSELRPGDLVFFEKDLGHMGMYLGGGQFIHAPHTGDVVKISPLAGWYAAQYAGAVRVTG